MASQQRPKAPRATTIDACTGVLLAGGESRRFGRNKALERLAGERLIDRALSVLRRLFPEQLLITNTPREYADVGIPILGDARPGHGSLGGLYTALLHSPHPWCFVVACDMPFLEPETIRMLSDRRDDYDVVVPRFDGRYETLHAFYRTTCVGAIERLLDEGRLRIDALYDDVTTCVVEVNDPSGLGGRNRAFFNVNTPDDLRRANELLADD